MTKSAIKSFITGLLCHLTCCSLFAQKSDARYFELRVYYAAPGKLDLLVDRFKNHTTRIFEKHRMENIGYWVPVNNDRNTLYYILAYPTKSARKESWDSFSADPEWKELATKSGKLVDSIVSVFMNSSDILPIINATPSGQERIFELRMYLCFPGRLPNLVTRFTNHTIKLFVKHHMDNIAYFASEENAGVQPKLIYLLAYPSLEASTKSWADFRTDPEWIAVRDASEKDGKIVDKVESVFLKPLNFSKIK